MSKWTKTERETCNLVRISNRKVNEFRTSPSNSDTHEVAKLKVFLELRRLGHNLITEAVFEGGLRADILDLTDSTAIEIGVSETKERFDKKDYPVKKVFLNAKDLVTDLIGE